MVTISGLWVYPIKSCAGIELNAATLTTDGLEWDRHWMLVDCEGEFLSQRQFPKMALVKPELGKDLLRVRAPGLPELEVPFEYGGQQVTATVWRDQCHAIDAGSWAAAWFSEALGAACRLVAFDKRVLRLCDRDFARDSGATTRFSDGYPLLIIGDASVCALNERLIEKGVDPIPMTRFRPNLTLRGIDAFDEDHVRDLRGSQNISLCLVKPCARCQITTVDPETGVPDAAGEPLATLNGFRANREFGTVLGQNAIVLSGAGRRLAVGDHLHVGWNF